MSFFPFPVVFINCLLLFSWNEHCTHFWTSLLWLKIIFFCTLKFPKCILSDFRTRIFCIEFDPDVYNIKLHFIYMLESRNYFYIMTECLIPCLHLEFSPKMVQDVVEMMFCGTFFYFAQGSVLAAPLLIFWAIDS